MANITTSLASVRPFSNKEKGRIEEGLLRFSRDISSIEILTTRVVRFRIKERAFQLSPQKKDPNILQGCWRKGQDYGGVELIFNLKSATLKKRVALYVA